MGIGNGCRIFDGLISFYHSNHDLNVLSLTSVLQKHAPRIVGGKTVEIGSAPWQAQLFRVRDNKKLSFQVSILSKCLSRILVILYLEFYLRDEVKE